MTTPQPAAEVRLRPVEDDDLPTHFAHQADPVSAAMAAFPTRDRDAFLAQWATIRVDRSTVLRTIVVGEVVVGHIVSWLEAGTREVGYWIGREYWGRGYATDALRLVLAEIAERPIVAHVALPNVGSRRVLERCGFVVVGDAVADDGVQEVILRLD